ncbi:MAG: ornithine cyclodeaminase family protein [Alphaproteobacteria bacterium]|nr:ornithine cyclodeaminase family protein [Alphaproteobacteria bacterium]
MRVVDAEQVHALLDYPSTVAALRELYRRGVDADESIIVSQPSPSGARDDLIILPAWQRGRHIGIKIVNVFPDNAGTPRPTIIGSYLLIDGATGVHLALMDGTALTLRKTAANSALAASYLARADALTMTMVGAGSLGPHVIMAHRAVRPSIRQVWVWNRTHAHAERLARDLALPGVRIQATADLEAAVRASDVVACATAATAPMVLGKWLKPGAHLDLIGGYTRDMRESDDDCVRRARVFVDGRARVAEECGDLCQPIAAGVLHPEAIVADLFELARGEKQGRSDDREITFFKNGGGGHQDLGCAQLVWQRMA